MHSQLVAVKHHGLSRCHAIRPERLALVQAPHGVGRKARRGGLAKGGHFPSGLVHKQRGAMLQRQGSGVSAALVCGNSLGTLIQALHAHENKVP